MAGLLETRVLLLGKQFGWYRQAPQPDKLKPTGRAWLGIDVRVTSGVAMSIDRIRNKIKFTSNNIDECKHRTIDYGNVNIRGIENKVYIFKLLAYLFSI